MAISVVASVNGTSGSVVGTVMIGLNLTEPEHLNWADAIIYAVPHAEFVQQGWGITSMMTKPKTPRQ